MSDSVFTGGPRSEPARRRLAAPVAATLLLAMAACSSGPAPGTVATVSGFAGIAAADEPRAALIGRDVLANNGTAADAAVAMGFAMSVTLPSRVGLGGGGACVVHRYADDADESQTEALVFLPRRGADGGMVPGTARGLAALHARYGQRDWRLLVAPAEQLARFGHVVSRALRKDLDAGLNRLSPGARRSFTGKDGELPEVGDRIRHDALSATLSGLREQGGGYLYTGGFARRFAEGAQASGVRIDAAELGAYKPAFAETLQVPVGDHAVHLPPPPVLGGMTAAQLWGMLRQWGGDGPELSADGAHFLIEAWKRALSARREWRETAPADRPEPASLVARQRLERQLANYDPGAATPAARLKPRPTVTGNDHATAGFAVADRFGNMVACSFTMNGLFGTGRQAEGTGVLLAGSASSALTGAALSPLVISNAFTGNAFFAASAGDGIQAQPGLVELVRRLQSFGLGQAAKQPGDLESLVASPRLHHPGRPDEVRVEPQVPMAVTGRLRTLGHSLVKAPGLGRIQAVYCPSGATEVASTCAAASDPRGHGLAVRAQ